MERLDIRAHEATAPVRSPGRHVPEAHVAK